MLSHCCSDTISIKVGSNFVDQARGAGQTANAVDHANGMIYGDRPVGIFGMFLALGPRSLNCRRGGHAQISDTSLR
jgi:hypothetical protein